MKSNGQILGQKSLLSFVISQNKNYIVGKHHREIANALEDVISGKTTRLIINMPPRFGKSLLVNQYFISYYMGLFPDRNVITTTFSHEKATDFGRNIRNQILSDEYKYIFPEVCLAPDSQAASKFSLVQGGELYAVGVNGALTGRGGSLIVMDDVIKGSDDAASVTQRNSLREWYQTVLRTRLTNNGAIILVMTRWSLDDIAGWLIESQKDQWKVLTLPALDEFGNSTWEEGFSTTTLQQTKIEIGSKAFNCLYQQKPEPVEDAIIKREWIQFHDQKLHDFNQMLISWDTSFKDSETSDYTVGIVIGKIKNDSNFYIVDVIREKMDFNKARKAMITMSLKYPKAHSIIEQSANGHALFQSLKNEIPGLLSNIVTDSKTSRMMAIAPNFEALNVLFPKIEFFPIIEECIQELIYFPRSQHDDFCDALSQGIIHLKSFRENLLI